MDDQFHVVIVGGGISGLSTAWYLQQQAVHVTVLEQSERWGGKIRTDMVEGFGDPFVVEAGPDSFLAQKPWAAQLARELGLETELLGTNDQARRVFVLNRGKLTPLPDGVFLIVPTRFMPFALSPLISPLGKLRMGMDLFIPPRQDTGDETLADFVRRRLGSEALDKIAEPLMSGIYNAESERQSLLATFPRFRDLEAQHGSLIRGMLASRRSGQGQNGHRPPDTPKGSAGTPVPTSAFLSFRTGSETLIRALVAQLTADLRLKTKVRQITPTPDNTYHVTLDNGDSLRADAVILTTPAYLAADLIRDFALEAAADLSAIRYVSTGTISLAYREDTIPCPPEGSGVVIPRTERRKINAITWSSAKFSHRAPDGYVLLRVFFGGSRNPGSMNLDDETLLRTVRGELKSILGADAEPLFHRIYRWMRANPQYDVGHLERVAALESKLPPGIFVTGSPYRGVGIPDCVHQAQQTAARVASAVAKHA